MTEKKGVLVLEDRDHPGNFLEFEGILRGAALSDDDYLKDRGYGEVVFNTSMTGYQEILTDPSYYGQIVCMTYPHIGNTGVNSDDEESKKPWCAGFVVHELCDLPSNWRSKESLESYLVRNGIPCLTQVDTRALTRRLRNFGVTRGIVLPRERREEARSWFERLPRFEGRDLISEVSTREPYSWGPAGKRGSNRFKVVAMDFGVKSNLLRCLSERGCEIEVVPSNTPAEQILNRRPDGVFLSNGPGDPSAVPYAAQTIRSLVGKVPLFGVCMGHQLLGLAVGGKTYKLKFGHRGANQPVQVVKSGSVEISSQNHGYAVDPKTLPKGVSVTHWSLFDQAVEGLVVEGKDAFSVQYHPEASPGPHDSFALFDQFIETMASKKR